MHERRNEPFDAGPTKRLVSKYNRAEGKRPARSRTQAGVSVPLSVVVVVVIVVPVVIDLVADLATRRLHGVDVHVRVTCPNCVDQPTEIPGQDALIDRPDHVVRREHALDFTFA